MEYHEKLHWKRADKNPDACECISFYQFTLLFMLSCVTNLLYGIIHLITWLGSNLIMNYILCEQPMFIWHGLNRTEGFAMYKIMYFFTSYTYKYQSNSLFKSLGLWLAEKMMYYLPSICKWTRFMTQHCTNSSVFLVKN